MGCIMVVKLNRRRFLKNELQILVGNEINFEFVVYIVVDMNCCLLLVVRKIYK